MAMNEAETRVKIRELMASGWLPPIERPDPPPRARWPYTLPHDSLLDLTCTICGQIGPLREYYYPVARIVRVHEACDELWKQEQAR